MSLSFLHAESAAAGDPGQLPGHDADTTGTWRGMRRLRAPECPAGGPRIQLLGACGAIHRVLEAQRLLASDWGVHADVWSVSSWSELLRDALDADGARLRGADRTPYVTAALSGVPGPVLAVSDGMREGPDQISPWVEQDYASLGTDDLGPHSDRDAVQPSSPVDAHSIVVTALHRLRRTGAVDPETVVNARARYGRRGDRPVQHPSS